jgi:hypothetical protein
MDESRKTLMASAAPLSSAEQRSPARRNAATDREAANTRERDRRRERRRRAAKRSRARGDDGGDDDGGDDDGDDDGYISPLQSALVVKPRGACVLLSIGVTRLYQLINRGDLQSFLDGKSRKITTASIRAYIARHLEVANGSPK